MRRQYEGRLLEPQESSGRVRLVLPGEEEWEDRRAGRSLRIAAAILVGCVTGALILTAVVFAFGGGK